MVLQPTQLNTVYAGQNSPGQVAITLIYYNLNCSLQYLLLAFTHLV